MSDEHFLVISVEAEEAAVTIVSMSDLHGPSLVEPIDWFWVAYEFVA